MEYMILFYTHSGAIKFQRKCKKENIPCELMPVPRILSSNCSISAKVTLEGDITNILDNEIEKIFAFKAGEYLLIYAGEL